MKEIIIVLAIALAAIVLAVAWGLVFYIYRANIRQVEMRKTIFRFGITVIYNPFLRKKPWEAKTHSRTHKNTDLIVRASTPESAVLTLKKQLLQERKDDSNV